jgi:hypothetical protein
MGNSMSRQQVTENETLKQAVMSAVGLTKITDIRNSANGIEVSGDNGATWKELASKTFVTDAITNAGNDILAGQLPQIEKVWWNSDGTTTTIFITVSHPLPNTVTPANCGVYDVETGTAIVVQTITKIDAKQFSVVTSPFGENKNLGVYYEI